MIYKTIYKRTSSGKTQTWFAEVDGDRYRTTAGYLDGKKTTTEWTVALPKNEGKANETTGDTQAIAEVEAEYEKKLKKDYHETLDAIDEVRHFKPMLATKWADRKDKIKDTKVCIQPKLDGFRCIVKADGMWTRTGEPIYGAPHIFESLKPFFDEDPTMVLDGELYNHDLKDDFNTLSSIIRKQNPTPEELETSKKIMQYWVYDLPSSKYGFARRYSSLQRFSIFNDSIKKVFTEYIDIKQVDIISQDYIDLGYEGSMVRLKDSLYENKRSTGLIKWKEFEDDEFLIDDIQEGVGNKSGMAARVVLTLSDGRKFGTGVLGNEDYCKELLARKGEWIGKLGTVKHQGYTPDGIPRFGKFKTVRFDV
jgi:DNA ligase-1